MKANISRGCGKRAAGGIYLCTEFAEVGTPLRYFLIDPPWIPMTEEGEIWSPGVQGLAIQQNPHSGYFDIWDWIGANYYPFFPDFYEEGKRFEFSRRSPKSLQYQLLEAGNSMQIYIHPKGFPQATPKLDYDHLVPGVGLEVCPHASGKHTQRINQDEVCTALLWQLVGEPRKYDEQFHTVEMPRSRPAEESPTFTYKAAAPNENQQIVWIPAAVLRLPIHKIEVVEDPTSDLDVDNHIHVSNLTDIPTEIVPF